MPPPEWLTVFIEGHEETLKWTTLQIRVQVQSANVPSDVDVGKTNFGTFTFTVNFKAANRNLKMVIDYSPRSL